MAEKHEGGLRMKYFVLKPAGDSPYAKAARRAMRAFAAAIDKENPALAYDLVLWVDSEEQNARLGEVYHG